MRVMEKKPIPGTIYEDFNRFRKAVKIANLLGEVDCTSKMAVKMNLAQWKVVIGIIRYKVISKATRELVIQELKAREDLRASIQKDVARLKKKRKNVR